ncbi:hypothetical protein Halru_1341 [Halovivax ruber XH-70]|uniref:Uncharacterized protein n=1 Tax=Halovivax ruber (strain DSM 18193 / JCM 13892 / XH-70) TaxID=797302 RepID=L0IB30_HALRX|nr:hypothetical protein [Halovivax ruber]AGB15954.1 hypothetical protein Halru_1341 [Halovivax ruber XH-70]
MATKQLMPDQSTEKSAGGVGDTSMGPAVMAAAASVGLSWYYFFLKGDKQRGLFVGLWPPTILAFASYFKQHQMEQTLSMLTSPGRSLKQTFDSMMGSS